MFTRRFNPLITLYCVFRSLNLSTLKILLPLHTLTCYIGYMAGKRKGKTITCNYSKFINEFIIVGPIVYQMCMTYMM